MPWECIGNTWAVVDTENKAELWLVFMVCGWIIGQDTDET